MIFFATSLSSYSAKVRIVLCVKGVKFEEREPPNGYKSAEYRAIVPMGTLPAVQVDDWVLSESEAINEYLEEVYPAIAMLPVDPRVRARVRFFCRFHDMYLEPQVRALFPHARAATRQPDLVAGIRSRIEARVQQLASWSQPDPYLLTPRISLADCGPLVTLPLASALLAACAQPLELPHKLRVWLDTASQHPGVARALQPWRQATDAWLAAA